MAIDAEVSRLYWPIQQSENMEPVWYRGYVEWLRREDRYAHRIGIETEHLSISLLESCEGTADETWPSSPPIQQTSSQSIGDRTVWLALGMAGRSHWSLSMEPHPTQLVIDVAARLGGTPQFLGSTYRILHGEWEHVTDGIIIAHASAPVQLLVSGDEATALQCDERDSGVSHLIARPNAPHAPARWRVHFELRLPRGQ